MVTTAAAVAIPAETVAVVAAIEADASVEKEVDNEVEVAVTETVSAEEADKAWELYTAQVS